MTERTQRRAVPLLLGALSLTTGLVDAASVLGLGEVFVANMTGNVVFLGLAAAGAPGFSAATHVLAIAAFLVGAAAAGRMAHALEARPGRKLALAAVTEAAFLWAAAWLALGVEVVGDGLSARQAAIVALAAFAMGVRNAVVRTLGPLSTTVVTSTLTGLAADAAVGDRGPMQQQRLAAVVALTAGAAAGAALVLWAGPALPLALAGLLVLLPMLLVARLPA